jgi:hypothetical protein
VAVELSPKAALRDVERATKARQRADTDRAEAMERQANAIRAAIAAGVTITQLVEATGLSRERVYQIRDHRR